MVKRGTPSKGGEEGEERQRGCPVPSSPGFQAFAGCIWSGTRHDQGHRLRLYVSAGVPKGLSGGKLDDVGLWCMNSAQG